MEQGDKEKVVQYVLDKIEELYGEDVLRQFKEIVDDKEKLSKDVEMLKLFQVDSKINFGLDSSLDDVYGRLYIYPDGIKNQRESIIVEYNHIAEMIYISGHGENTSVNYVCKPTQEEVTYCLMTVIDKFRKDNEWTWEMPCEVRYKEQNN